MEIAPNIYSEREGGELSKHLERVDLVLIDLDDCLYSGTTNITLFKNLCLLLARKRMVKDLARLLRSLPVLFLMKDRQLLKAGVTNPELTLYFSRMVSRVPFSCLQTAAKPIPSGSFPGVEETLKALSKKARIGLISLGLDVVLEEYMVQFPLIDFFDCVPVAQGFPKKTIDKAEKARERIEEFKAEMPLVIGHNSDDLGMIKMAREYGGLALGFNPSGEVIEECDIVVKAGDWQPLAKYLQSILF